VKKLVVVAVVVVILCGAGVAGAVVVGTVSNVGPGQFARLGGTGVFCGAYVEAGNKLPAFDCGAFTGSAHVAGSYSAILDRAGVEVDHWDASGRHRHATVTYLNR
jgi:opacity protein-like surface antigen